MKTELVKGFKDYSGEDAKKRAEIKKILVETFEKYGFEPAETPIIEYEEFVKGENPGDEAVRDVFKLQDRGKRKLALRYEFTFQLKRLAKNKKLPYKRYQIGDVFRDEPIKQGRTRQFIQCDIDVVGSTIKNEAEVLSLTKEVLEKLGIKSKIYINNRKLINEILIKNKIKENDLENVIREIDKLNKITKKEIKKNLKKYNAEKIIDLFEKDEKEFEKYENYKEIKELKKYCKFFNVDVEFKPSLARGLSYYNGSVFEIESKKIKVSICGGGSYLINGIQSTGIAFGFEPIFLIADLNIKKEKYLVISLNQDKEAIKLTNKLRKNNSVSIFYGKPSKALEYANSYNYNKVIFVGEKEVKSKNFVVKNMDTGRQQIMVIKKRVLKGKI